MSSKKFKQAVLDIAFLTGHRPQLMHYSPHDRQIKMTSKEGLTHSRPIVMDPVSGHPLVEETVIECRDQIVEFLKSEQSLTDLSNEMEQILDEEEERLKILAMTPVDWAVVSFNEAVGLYGQDTDEFVQAITRLLSDLTQDVMDDEDLLVASLFMHLKIYDYLLEWYVDDLDTPQHGSIAWMADTIANTLDHHGAEPDRDWDTALDTPEWEEEEVEIETEIPVPVLTDR